jgi:hypothetical protein
MAPNMFGNTDNLQLSTNGCKIVQIMIENYEKVRNPLLGYCFLNILF